MADPEFVYNLLASMPKRISDVTEFLMVEAPLIINVHFYCYFNMAHSGIWVWFFIRGFI